MGRVISLACHWCLSWVMSIHLSQEKSCHAHVLSSKHWSFGVTFIFVNIKDHRLLLHFSLSLQVGMLFGIWYHFFFLWVLPCDFVTSVLLMPKMSVLWLFRRCLWGDKVTSFSVSDWGYYTYCRGLVLCNVSVGSYQGELEISLWPLFTCAMLWPGSLLGFLLTFHSVSQVYCRKEFHSKRGSHSSSMDQRQVWRNTW